MGNERILFIPQRGIGDLIHSLPLIHSLRQAYKNSKLIIPVVDRTQKESYRSLGHLLEGIVTFLEKPIYEDLELKREALYRGEDFKDKYTFESPRRQKFEEELYRKSLSGERYDLAIVIRKFRIYLPSCKNQITLEDLAKEEGIHLVDRNLKFADCLGIPKLLNFGLNISRDSIKDVYGNDLSLPENSVVLILNAGRTSKEWTKKGNLEVAKFCISAGYTPILIGSFEEEFAEEIPSIIRFFDKDRYSIDLENSAKVFLTSKAIIGPDTGLVHLADAVGAPTIGLYGPTRPSKFAPYNNRERVISTSHLTGRMEDIKAKDVIRELERVLN